MSALAGRTVLVTRAREQSAPLCDQLAALGARAIALPVITIAPVPNAELHGCFHRLGGFDWVVFTSANAVRCFWSLLARTGRSSLPPGVRVAAIGPATAAALREVGASTAAMPTAFRATELPGAMGAIAGSSVLVPRSEQGRDDTISALAAGGARVEHLAIYRTVAARPPAEQLRVLGERIDAVTFASPSAVNAFHALGDPARSVMTRTALACIGPTTGAAVRALGLRAAIVCERHTIPALARALETWFARGPAEAAC